MIITLANNRQIDTDNDLSPAERHVIQKLLGWREFARSSKEFREKSDQTLQTGWNNTGPVRKTETMRLIIQQFEQEVEERYKK